MENKEYHAALQDFRFNEALFIIWRKIASLDGYINDEKPWVLLKTEDPRIKEVLSYCVDHILEVAVLLEPFMPETSLKIKEQFKGPQIKSDTSLFPRIS